MNRLLSLQERGRDHPFCQSFERKKRGGVERLSVEIERELHSVGFEPTTNNLEGYCSLPTELRVQAIWGVFFAKKKPQIAISLFSPQKNERIENGASLLLTIGLEPIFSKRTDFKSVVSTDFTK